ncbi:MAG: multiheme c-type cytochrome, partial [Planctomycetota bacterium]
MPTAPSLPTLPAGQRILLRVLVAAFVFLAAGGLFLLGSDGSSVVAAGLLLLHLGVGVAAAVLALVFVVPHALARGLSWPAAGALGVALLVATLLVAATGFLLLDGKAFAGRAAWWGHVVFGYGLFLLYVLHRALGPRPPPACRVGALAAAPPAGGLLSALLGPRGAGPPARDADGGVSPFAPSRATTASGTELENAHAPRDSASCGRCHRRITEDWARSAHRHASFTNPFYRGTVLAMRERYAPEDLQFCAGCHDPALLFTGKMRSPELDVDDDPDAQVGIACVVCHAMERRDLLGNGGYVLGERAVYPWEGSENASLRSLHDFLLRANPEAHRKTLRPADVGRATFCSVCHKAEIPKSLNQWRWFRAQDEYDAWDDSGVSWGSIRSFHHPSRPRACQDCHMPRVRDPQDPTADASGTVRSHLFAAANTALPHLRGDEALVEETRRFLRRACRVHIEAVELAGLEAGTPPRRFAPARRALDAVRPGQVIEVQVLVRNVGVGHGFPGGTTDSNEVWLAFEARVGDAPPFFRSGGVDEASGRVDETAEFYRSYLLDGEGRRVVSRIGPDVRTRLYVRRIPPGAADVVRYRFRVPEGAKGRLGVRAVLRYRKFMRPYVDFLFPEGHEPLPIVDLAEAEAAFAIRAGYEAGLPPDPAAVARPGDRDAL